MLSPELKASLQELLSEEQVKAFTAKLEMLVEEKVSNRVASVLEEERAEMKETLANTADKFVQEEVKRQVDSAKADFDRVIEEQKEQYDTELAEAVKNIESEMVKKFDTLIEEEIAVQIPENVQHDVALARNYSPIVDGVRKLFEEHLVCLDADTNTQIANLTEKLTALEEQLNTETESRIELKRENETVKRQLLVEQKAGHLTESKKEKLLMLVEDVAFENLHERIDSTIEILEESHGENYDSGSIENNDADIDPNASVGDVGSGNGEGSVLEEQKDAQTAQVIGGDSNMSDRFMSMVDNLL